MNKEGEPVAAKRMLKEGELALKCFKCPRESYFSQENWDEMSERTSSLSSIVLEEMAKQRTALEKVYGDEVDGIIRQTLEQASANIYRKSSGGPVLNREKYERIKSLAAYLEPQQEARILLNLELNIAMEAEDWMKVVSLLKQGEKQGLTDKVLLGWYAMDLLQCDDSKVREQAKKWLEEAIRVAPADARYLPRFKEALDQIK